MCRLFGFKSVIKSQVHRSLVSADNALAHQSKQHPDGWGMAYYIDSSPHVVKSPLTAEDDTVFKKISGIISSQTVLAHIRKATQGSTSQLNTHPFQYGRWVFAHNGNIENFETVKKKLYNECHPRFKRFVLGETDSELIFYFLLSELEAKIDINDYDLSTLELLEAIKTSLRALTRIVGPFKEDTSTNPRLNSYTFLLSDGDFLVAYQGGQNLFCSTYKNFCADKANCDSFAPECEKPNSSGKVTHLIFSSEELQGENVWIPMAPGELIGVGPDMIVHRA